MKKQASLLRLSVVLRQQPVRLRPLNWLQALPWRDSIWDGTRLRQASIWQPSIPDLAWLYAAYALMGLEPPQHHRVLASRRVSHASANNRGWVRPALFSSGVEQKFLSAPSSAQENAPVGMRLPTPPRNIRKTQIAAIAQDVTYVRAQEEKREVVAQQLRPVSLLAQAKIAPNVARTQEGIQVEKRPSLSQLRSIYAPKRYLRKDSDSFEPDVFLSTRSSEESSFVAEKPSKIIRQTSTQQSKVSPKIGLEGEVSVSKRARSIASLRAPVSMEGDAHQTMPWRRPIITNTREGDGADSDVGEENSTKKTSNDMGRFLATERRLVQPTMGNEIVFTPAREGSTEEEYAQLKRIQKQKSIQQVARGTARIEAGRLLRPQKKSIQEERTEVVFRKKREQPVVSEKNIVEKTSTADITPKQEPKKQKSFENEIVEQLPARQAKKAVERELPKWSKPASIEKTGTLRLSLESGQVVSVPVGSLAKFLENKSPEESKSIRKQVTRIIEERKKRPLLSRGESPEIVRIRQDSGQVVSVPIASLTTFLQGKSSEEAERITKQVTRIVEERKKIQVQRVSEGIDAVSKRPLLSRGESPEIVRIRQDSGQVVSVPIATLSTFLQGKSSEEAERITTQVTRIVEERKKAHKKLVSKGIDVVSKRPLLSRGESPEIVRIRQDSGQVVSVPVASLPTFLQGKSPEEAERITKQISYKSKIVEKKASKSPTSTHVVASVRRFLEKSEVPVIFRKEILALIEKDISVSIDTVEEAIQQQILPPKTGKALVVILKQERVRQRKVSSSQSVPSPKYSSLRPMASVMRRAKQEIVQQSVSSQTVVSAEAQNIIYEKKPQQLGFSRSISPSKEHFVVSGVAATRSIQYISKPTETVLPVSKGSSKVENRSKIPDPPLSSSQTSSRTKKEQPKAKYGPKKKSITKVWTAPDSMMETTEEEIGIPLEREEEKQILQKEKKKRKEPPRKVNPKISDQLLLEILQELTEDKPEARQLLKEISTHVDFLKRLDDLRKL